LISPFDRNEIGKALAGGEKALGPWAALGSKRRYSIGARVLAQVRDLTESDRSLSLTALLRVAGRAFSGESGVLSVQRPYGLTALLLLDPETLTTAQALLPLLVTLVPGNVALVVSVFKEGRGLGPSIVEACKSQLPTGVAHFLTAPTLSQAFEELSGAGKVSLVWMLHSGKGAPALSWIPRQRFCRVLVDDGRELERTIVSRGKQTEISKAIYL
jgi:hypothetical protein